MSLPAVKVKQTPKHTPDLVLDLPDGNGNSSTDSAEPDSPTGLSAAENFAQSNQGTLKKTPGDEPRLRHSGQDAGSRLSISSEPGDIARPQGMIYGRPTPTNVMNTSQTPMSTFAISNLKRAQSAMPSSGMPIDNQQSQHSLVDSKISALSSIGGVSSSFSSHAAPSAPTPPVFIPPVPKIHQTSAGTVVPPPVAQKPKPPMKVKPAVMKKPATPPRTDLVTPPPFHPAL